MIAGFLILIQRKGWYSRFTNIILLFASVQLTLALGFWYITLEKEDCVTFTSYGRAVYLLPLIGFTEIISFIINRRFAVKLQDANFMEKLLRNTETESM